MQYSRSYSSKPWLALSAFLFSSHLLLLGCSDPPKDLQEPGSNGNVDVPPGPTPLPDGGPDSETGPPPEPDDGGPDAKMDAKMDAKPEPHVCEGETFDHDGDASTACEAWTVCVPGEHVSREGDAESDRECAPCASGTYSAEENVAACAEWTVCEAGSYVSAEGAEDADRTCAPCDEGTFSTQVNQTLCLPAHVCPAGTEQEEAATETSEAVCRACAVGTSCAGGTAAAAACDGETWDDDANPATACVAHTRCGPGSYVASEGDAVTDRVCAGCASGHYSTQSNAAQCQAWSNCEAGTYVTHEPSVVRDRECSACADGTYTNGENQEICLTAEDCKAGTVQVQAATESTPPVCEPCDPGEYCAGGTSPAEVCGEDAFDDDDNAATPCVVRTQCAAGGYVEDDGDALNDRRCAACTSGSFSNESNAAQCEGWSDCVAGTHVTQQPSPSRDRRCAPCADGTFTSAPNQASCLPVDSCEAGTVQTRAATSTSAPECEACAAGTYCAGDTAPAVACASSTWDHDGDASTPCVVRSRCAAGQYVQSGGSAVADRVCQDCAAGTFSTRENTDRCAAWTACAVGFEEGVPGSATRDRQCKEASWAASFERFGEFEDPSFIAGSHAWGVYVGGRNRDYVKRFGPAGTGQWELPLAADADLQALASDEQGSLYVVVDKSLRKYDASMALIWDRTLPDSNPAAVALQVDAQHNVYLELMPGTGGKNTLHKFDSEAVWKWYVEYGEPHDGSYPPPLAMRVDAAGKVVLAEGTQGGSVVRVRTLDANGNTTASRTVNVGMPIPYRTEMDVDALGNLYVHDAQFRYPDADVDDLAGTVSKFGPDGSLAWRRRVVQDAGRTMALAVADDGNVFVGVHVFGANFETYLLQLEPNGSEGWARKLDVLSDTSYLVAPMNGARAYVTTAYYGDFPGTALKVFEVGP